MASAAEQLASNLNWGAIGKATELRRRLWVTIGALVVFRIGAYIPVPGVDPVALAEMFSRNAGGLAGMLDVFSGGSIGRMSILALSIMPYISASIIMQILTTVVPSLEALKKEGEAGRKKINQYTRYGTVVQYPKRQVGNKMYGGEASHLPLKINTSGVIPPIFASSLLLFPATIAGFQGNSGEPGIAQWIATYLAHGQPLYLLAYIGLIV